MKIVEKNELSKLTIDDRFTCSCVSCHPDVTDASCACKWRFELAE